MTSTNQHSGMENHGENTRARSYRKWVAMAVLALGSAAIAVFMLLRGPSGETLRHAPEPSAAPAAITLRLGHDMTEDSAVHVAAVRFAQEVESRSRGKLRVSVHPREQLGNDLQMLEMAKEGKLDMVLTPTAKLSSDIPAMQYVDLPFYFSSPAELYAMLDGEPGQLLLDRLESVGLVGVTFWENGFKHFTSIRPLHRPEDFRKLRFRTMKSRLIMDQFEALGAKPVLIEFSATYQALADGAVDGQENPLASIVGMNFHKVQPHLTLSSHGYLGYVFSISARVFEGLSPEARGLLVATARELAPWEREEAKRRDAVFLEQVRAAGVTVHELTPQERKAFAAALVHIPRHFEAALGADLLDKTEKLRRRDVPNDQRVRFDRHGQ